jgi:hypothetical protein
MFDIYAPVIKLLINNIVLFDGPATQAIVIEQLKSLTDRVQIEIYLQDKKYSSEHETALVIKSINFDGFELVPVYISRAIYINDHNYEQPTNYMGFNGCWKLDIDRPFYQWLHGATNQGWLLKPGQSD